MNGFINLYKPLGMSSGQAVARVKRLFHDKAGHAGTLDPEAMGVLPVMVGQAARLFDFIVDKQKVYVAELCMGASTDTQDAQGKVLETSASLPDESDIRAVIPRFEGDILQTPPMYSALHMDGKRLYELARDGKTVDRAARAVHIDRIRLLAQMTETVYQIEVVCRKGVYIRTLCEDIGRACGCPAHMRALERTQAGVYHATDAVTPDALAEAPFQYLRPMDEPLAALLRLDVRTGSEMHAQNGMPLPLDRYDAERAPQPGECVRVYLQNEFLGLAERTDDQIRYRMVIHK